MSIAMGTGSPRDLSPTPQERTSTMKIDPQQDLRATELSIQKDAERVKTLEEEKSELDPADPRVEQISERVVDLTAGLQAKAAAEHEISKEIQEAG
jgi:hypothetical protein